MTPPGGFHTKTEWIYAELRDLITAGDLASGSRLRLTELAARFGTSEIPVREALRMLQQDGLVTIESHRGATVAGVSWDELHEAILVRTFLEILAVREATPFHTPETLSGVRAALEAMDRLAQSRSPSAPDRFSEQNREFHRRLYEPCPFPVLRDLIQELWDRVWRTRSQSLFYMEREHMLRVQADHRGIHEAIEAGDADRAASLAEHHRASNLAAWRRVIDRARGQGDGRDPVTQPARTRRRTRRAAEPA
jgi:DNA-binding GntR family transcriptional regulator